MNMIRDKILVMAGDGTAAAIKKAARVFSNIEILEAGNENKAFELIYNHTLVLVIIDAALPQIEPYRIGSMLMSHIQVHNTPLLILCDEIDADNFLADFGALKTDYLRRPFTDQQVQAKIKLFFELFKLSDAVHQSIDELDRVYRKILDQHEQSAKEDAAVKNLTTRTSYAANQIEQSLRSLSGNMYHLVRNRDLPVSVRSRLSAIKTGAEGISLSTKKLVSHLRYAKPAASQNIHNILCVQGNDEDFSIFNHAIKAAARCSLTQAKSVAQGLELVYRHSFDLIFIDYTQPDGTGLELLAKLNRIRSDIPVIFTMDAPYAHKGPEAVSKGAFAYLLKEGLSSTQMLSIIRNTLEKASLTREVEEAQNRIVMISQKDYLTRLLNRRCFEQELETELSKAKRYRTDLSVLLIEFDAFQAINESHGFDTGDQVLAASATIIQGMVRNNDVVCRYGTEEFGIILPNTDLDGAGMLAGRIRKKIAGFDFEAADGRLNITVSIGLAAFDNRTDTTFSHLVKKGLDALAAAVENGGNTVKTYATPNIA